MAASRAAAPLARRHFKSHGVLSPDEWAQIFAEESRSTGVKMTPKEIAEGVGILEYESSGDASNFGQGPTGHIGGLSESPTFGSVQERLNPRLAVRAGIKQWASDGKSWWPAWGRWQEEQRSDHTPGSALWKKYLPLAERALGGAGQNAVGIPGSRPSAVQSEESTPEGVQSDLMHAGLVAVLVLGGVGMVGLGVSRVFGTAAKGRGA